MAWGSVIIIGNSIYSFGGKNDNTGDEFRYPIQRMEITKDGEIKNIVLIGSQIEYYHYPILIKSEHNTCNPCKLYSKVFSYYFSCQRGSF